MADVFYLNEPKYALYLKKLCSLKRNYPLLKLFSIGRTVQGKKIYALSLGRMQNPTLFAGAFHAQEWLTQSLLTKFLEEILNEYLRGGEIKKALDRRGVIIIPSVNLDGVELVLSGGKSANEYSCFIRKISKGDLSSWNANIRGVDLNHNFDAGHNILRQQEIKSGITGPAPRQFGGFYPNSEIETRALVSLVRKILPSRVYAFHSQGEEIFYSYNGITPPKSLLIANTLSKISGYTLVNQTGLASHGGFKDYFIKEYNRPGFTIEIGRGKNPLPIDELEPIFARLYETMVMALII